MIEKVKEIIKEYDPDYVTEADESDLDQFAQQICQLFEPKPDEGRLLTDMGRTQQVGNKNEDAFTMACVLCGDTKELTLTAHRSMSGKVCGWLVACIQCQPKLCDFCFVDAKTASIKESECQDRVERINGAWVKWTRKETSRERLSELIGMNFYELTSALKKKEGVKK